ncbi:hypothetical protein [Helcococcus ovis]|uniref:hypothetical protein n=5 Tax=Helcococcus ovis TaxID=72026 RepID=UPI0038BD1FCA
MKKLLIYNKRSILQHVIFSISFSLLLLIFIIYFSPVRYYQQSFEKYKKANLKNTYFVINSNQKKLSKEFFIELKNKKNVKNIFLNVFPNWKIDENSGLYSLPQFYDLEDYNIFPIKLNNDINILKLKKLPENNYYLILSPFSKAKVGDKIRLVDKDNNIVILHAISREKIDQIYLDTFNYSSKNIWANIFKISNKRDYIIVDNKYDSIYKWFNSNNFLIEFSENEKNKNESVINYLKSNDFYLEGAANINANTVQTINRAIYLNISFLITGFLIFTLLFINLSFLNNYRFNKRYIIYRKLGATNLEIVFYRILANILALLFGLLLSWIFIYILNIIKPDIIFMKENLSFDTTLFTWTLTIFMFYVLLSCFIQIVNLRDKFKKRGCR